MQRKTGLVYNLCYLLYLRYSIEMRIWCIKIGQVLVLHQYKFSNQNLLKVVFFTGCCSLVVVLSLSKREVVSSSTSCAYRVKPKTFRIGSDCTFALHRQW
jgi:hypothetical protein